MDSIYKTPRKLTSLEFHGIKWQLQKSHAEIEYKIEKENRALEISSVNMVEYHEKQIAHLNSEAETLGGLIDAFTYNSRALYDLPKSDA